MDPRGAIGFCYRVQLSHDEYGAAIGLARERVDLHLAKRKLIAGVQWG
jgi:hypothetical protein